MSRYLFTSESVSEGHPDKLCDQVSDAVLDAAISEDPRSRVACETLCKTGFIIVAGEITTQAKNLDFGKIARNVVTDIGYTDSAMGFDAATCAVLIAVEPQSPDISQGVTEGQGLFKDQGAGDQGLMMSYANGHLSYHGAQCTENLQGLVAAGSENIWACGKNGRLLYSGTKQFPSQ